MVGNLSITFGQPWWLILIPLILPLLVWMGFRSLAGLGSVRRALAILLRAGVITLIVLALAETQTVRRSDRLTTLFVVDVSYSVPREQQLASIEYVRGASKKRRKDDMAGLIVFGKAPRIEVPPAPASSICRWASKARSTPRTPTRAPPSSWRWRRSPRTRRGGWWSSPTAMRTGATCSSRQWPPSRWASRWTLCRSSIAMTATSW